MGVARLVEKFRVHSQETRAETLDCLTSSFLSSSLHGCYQQVSPFLSLSLSLSLSLFPLSLVEGSCVSLSLSQSEIHYRVLQLLLSLSEQPTAVPWEPPREGDPVRQGN